MKILITGAGGYLAWEIIRQLKQYSSYDLIAVTSSPKKLSEDNNFDDIGIIDNIDFINSNLSGIDVIIHTAFCRKSIGCELYDSLDFSKKVFQKAVFNNVGTLINISSQSVYGGKTLVGLASEDTHCNPEYLYSLAKASSELLLNSVIESTKSSTRYTSIRMASLIGPSKFVPNNILYKFIKNAVEGQTIQIQGGKQNFSFLDVRDAANAIIQLIMSTNKTLDPVYNLGIGEQISIVELAQCVVNCVEKKGFGPVNIEVAQDDISLNPGMVIEKIMNTADWTPRYSIKDTIIDTLDYILRLH